METLHPTLGHVHLTVADIDRALLFYRDMLGFHITARYGDDAVFLASGEYHHHIALNTWAGKGAVPAPAGHTGLYHVALVYPTRRELAIALRRIMRAGYHVDGTAHHGVSESVYVRDPDQNSIELSVDTPRDQWGADEAGGVVMKTGYLDLGALLAEAEAEAEEEEK